MPLQREKKMKPVIFNDTWRRETWISLFPRHELLSSN